MVHIILKSYWEKYIEKIDTSMTFKPMAELYNTTKKNISSHTKNIYYEGELDYN